MWRYVEILFDKFTLPHYIVTWDGSSKSLKRRTGKQLKYFILYEVNSNINVVLMVYYHLTIGFSTQETLIQASTKPLLVIFGLLTMGSAFLSKIFIYTLAFNDGKFINATDVTVKFLHILNGNQSIFYYGLSLITHCCCWLGKI
jgi:hypothetical protein